MTAEIELLKKENDRLRGELLNTVRVLIDHEVDGTIWINQHTTLAEHLRVAGQVCPLLRGETPLFPEADTIQDSAVIDALTIELERERTRRRELECKVERLESGLTLEDSKHLCDALDHIGEMAS